MVGTVPGVTTVPGVIAMPATCTRVPSVLLVHRMIVPSVLLVRGMIVPSVHRMIVPHMLVGPLCSRVFVARVGVCRGRVMCVRIGHEGLLGQVW